MRQVGAVLLAMLPLAAAAQDFPAAFSVTGVAADDALNIRAKPSANAEIIGQIGPHALNIEVLELSANTKWGKVGTPESNGWVAMTFLDLTPPADPTKVQRPLSCRGTEPFWSVSLYPGGAEYNSPDTGAVPLTVISESVAPTGALVTLEEGPTMTHTLLVLREACSDGMSDRAYGFSTRLFTEAPDGNSAAKGCCTLDHR
jgi:uncharacterized membrane protein